MPSKKTILSFEDDSESDYHVLAIHTTLEDYRLAFHLNKVLFIFFHRDEKHNICINKNESLAPRYYFSYHDNFEFITYFLIENKHQYNQENTIHDLFSSDITQTNTYFIENEKKANYILILKGESIDYKITEITKLLKKESFINSIYSISTQKIKHKYYYDLTP